MIIHGPGIESAGPDVWLPCCGRALERSAQGIVTMDPDAVTCRGFTVEHGPMDGFHETFDRITYWHTTGDYIRLDYGTLDIGLLRDFSVGFGDRWRPWKRHLHRLGPRVWRLFGWKPTDFEPFIESWRS